MKQPKQMPNHLSHSSRKFIVLKLLFLVGLVALLIACGAGAYWATGFVFHYAGLTQSEFIRAVVSSFLSFVLFILIASVISRFVRPRHLELFQLLIDALRRIAKGDFNVNLDFKVEREWGQLVAGINHMAEQLQEMENMRQEFISNVSHEIQSPLTSIRGFARALQNDSLSAEERQHYLEIIETESNRLSKISDNLLKLTSLEGKHHPFERKRYRLDQQLQQIILACEPQWLDKEIEMELDLEKVHIVADEDMMSQVWNNLLANSIKFTEPGGQIRVALHEQQGAVQVRISDTGIGIAKENLERIFERFFKEDKSRNRTTGGSGLGLSIVKKIVEMHEATISVESEPGKGTTFTVAWPSEQADAQPDGQPGAEEQHRKRKRP
ncbi:sensor histidine kinase [Brevibacillus parabrevis]|uniref:sensor histidine kinase n=1 Tax=Brevibacillus parabrevis TaxID=54914 RepID=UPI001C230C5A|nr:HAMP domain-containing sensor histidine kinase [Brevibacillus parabrevis]MBU8714384.1 HAMP domain-containing histidine kinase [Brevibacillus parabrevis]MED2254908.1 HAMP domain-containing sensor histidine kinase [Brevibacillus parabrevis]WDV93848.1 HAMP domain-containing sensor histidine kinase [Brevibacillus parabrevis]